MSDRFRAEITIGGRIRRSLIPGLIQSINQQSCQKEWSGECLQIDCSASAQAEAKLLECVVVGDTDSSCKGRLFLCDEEASCGEMAFIEDFCRENDIAFHRFSEGFWERSPQGVEFRPGMADVVSFVADSDGDSTVNGEAVKKLLRLLDTLPSDSLKVQEQIKALRELLPPDLPEIEQFEIVEG